MNLTDLKIELYVLKKKKAEEIELVNREHDPKINALESQIEGIRKKTHKAQARAAKNMR